MAWHSISPARRRALLSLAPGRALVRSARVPGYYDAVGATLPMAKIWTRWSQRSDAGAHRARDVPAWGRSSGAAAGVAERCRGEAVRETGGGVACSFWLREPARGTGR